MVRKQASAMEVETRRFYEQAASLAKDASIRQLLDDLAQQERVHEDRADELTEENLRPDAKEDEDKASRRLFVLQVVQPGLAGLMDGSVSTLAPVLAAALATRNSWDASLSGWPHPWGQVSVWDLPRRCLMTEALRGAGIHGHAV
jgi:rubrerythrin